MDLNGDGALELACTDDINHHVTVLVNQGNGTFGAPQAYPAGGSPNGIAAADLNGDGAAELAVTSLSPDTVTILFSACLP